MQSDEESLDIFVHEHPEKVCGFLCLKGKILDEFIIQNVDNQRLVITLSNTGWNTWGEIVTIEIKSTENENTQIHISSVSVQPPRLWVQNEQKNQYNIKRIANYMYSVFSCAV